MLHDSTGCILCGKHCRFISTNKISIYFYTFVGVVLFFGFFVFHYYFHYYYLFFYLYVLFTFIFVCVCVCGFFVSMGRVFNGRRVCGSLQLYQRQEFNKTNCCLCCLLFRFKIRDIFSYYSCVLWL